MLTARPWSDPSYAAAARLVTRQAGLTLKTVRRPAVESGIRRAMERADIADIGEYINLLEAEPMALDDLVTELTVGETYFFREPGHYEFLRREVLPDIRRRRGSGHTLRAWSAGCSTGEEAYSLAIVLEEEGLSEQAYLLGTDISRRALRAARLARYRRWSFRGADDTVLGTYFRRISDTELERRDQFELAARFRRRVHFEYLNLALDTYPSLGTGTWGMDIIFCRNVLIYFDPHTNLSRKSRRPTNGSRRSSEVLWSDTSMSNWRSCFDRSAESRREEVECPARKNPAACRASHEDVEGNLRISTYPAGAFVT